MNIMPKNKFMLSIITSLVFVSVVTALTPNKGQWKQLTYIDGLSSNYIFDVAKDDQGRVWVATQNGITMLNGESIVKYGAKDGLPAADIIKVATLKDVVYVATSNKGVFVLVKGSFKKLSEVKGSDVQTMEKIGNQLFISTNLENVLYDGGDVSFMGRGFPNGQVKDVFIDQEKVYYVSDKKIIQKEGSRFVSKTVQFPGTKTKIQSFLISDGVEYFGTNQGLWSREDDSSLKAIQKNINIQCLSILSTKTVLAGSKKGLFYVSKGKLKAYRPTGDRHSALAKTPIRGIKVISNNEVWYSTFGMGLYLHDPSTFINLGPDDGLNTGGMVYDLLTIKGVVYIATSNGLFTYKNGDIKRHFTTKDGLPSNKVLDMDLDSKGILWLATSKGLSRYTGSGFKNYSRKDGLPSNLITAVHVDKNDDSRIWTGSTSSGLTRFDSDGFFTFAVQDGLPSNTIRDIIGLDNGDLAIACYNKGVAIYNGKSFKLFNNGLDDKRVISIEVSTNNKIWAGTESAGIGVLNNDSFTMIRDSDGLGHNELFSLYNDGSRMWAGTFGGGVSCLTKDTWFTINELDGINSNMIGAIVALGTDQVVIGGENGISIFSISDKLFRLGVNNIITPRSDLSMDDILEKEVSGIVKDRFYVHANPIFYKPVGLDVKYRTRINKTGNTEKSEWSNLETSSQISYTATEVGSFKLEIQSIDNRVSFSNIVTIPFKIGRVWYLDPKTAVPFWGSLLLLIGFSTVTYINYRKKSQEAEDLREADIERQQAEMEEAREFQQAMLPSEMPSTDDYEMVGFQQTATEVGGDFFDFVQKEDGKWIAICGDATGHGLTSGNVVSITKTAMSALAEEGPVETLDSLNKTLLKMNIGLNRMCLNIANLGKDSIQFSSAGMPPAYHYSAETEALEEILVGALPLGSFAGAMHSMHEVPFKNKGDLLILMSDGLPEAENANDEMVGYEKTEEAIRSLASKSAEEIKDGLVKLCDEWLAGDAELKDDMTFVIIKRK